MSRPLELRGLQVDSSAALVGGEATSLQAPFASWNELEELRGEAREKCAIQLVAPPPLVLSIQFHRLRP